MGDEEKVVLFKPQNFREWHNSIKGLANDQKVWDYVDPAKTKSVPERDEPPTFDLYQVVTADGARPATRFSELTALQRESYREDMQNWRYSETYFDSISKGISTVRSAITKSASDCIPTDLKAGSAREILRFLTEQYQLEESDEIEAVKTRYRSLCTPPTKDKVQKWIIEWECLRYDIVSLKVGEISEQQMTLDFLKAGSKWVGIWAEMWPIGLRTAGRPIEFFDTAKEYRAKVLQQEMSSTPSFAEAVFDAPNYSASRSNSRPRQPLCSLCAKHPNTQKCYWIKQSGRRAPWTENENVKAQLQAKIRESYNLFKEIEELYPDTGILDGITFNDNDSAAVISHVDDTPFRHYGNAAFSRLDEADFTAKITSSTISATPKTSTTSPSVWHDQLGHIEQKNEFESTPTRQRNGDNLPKLNDDSPDDFIPVLPTPFYTASSHITSEPTPPKSSWHSPPPSVSPPPSPPRTGSGSRIQKKTTGELDDDRTDYAGYNTLHHAFAAGIQNTLHRTQIVEPPDHWGNLNHHPHAALRWRSRRRNGPTPEGVETLNCTPGRQVQRTTDCHWRIEWFEKALFIVF